MMSSVMFFMEMKHNHRAKMQPKMHKQLPPEWYLILKEECKCLKSENCVRFACAETPMVCTVYFLMLIIMTKIVHLRHVLAQPRRKKLTEVTLKNGRTVRDSMRPRTHPNMVSPWAMENQLFFMDDGCIQTCPQCLAAFMADKL